MTGRSYDDRGGPGRRPVQQPSRQPVRRAPGRPQRPPQRRPVQRRPVQRRRGERTLRLGGLHGRLRFGFAAMCTLLLVVGGRLVQLQGLDGQRYAGAAAAQRIDTEQVHALRGKILDRNGTVLAYTSMAQDITVDPRQVAPAKRAAYAAKLSPLLGSTPAAIEKVFRTKGGYAVLATALSPVLAAKISDLGLFGIYTEATTQRRYPGTTTAASVLGTVHSDGTGAAGIEYAYNHVLAGKDGSITYSVDNEGNVNPSSRDVTAQVHNGSTVRLTIDQSLNYMFQHYLDQAVGESGASDAQGVVLDAHTGQVLAMASSGTFDAADPGSAPLSNPALTDPFEPGSVQKSITFAAALQQGLITPKSVIQVPDRFRDGGVTISDAWYHPTEPFTATGVLAMSSNVGTLKIANRVGPTTWMKYERAFGVGTKTGIELPGESAGYLPPRSTWSASTFANLPFGQGESMTVLQLASIYQTIANNGVRVPPRIVESVTSQDGTVHPTKQPAGIRAITPQTAHTLRTMLESVIMPGGTGVKAAIPGYEIAGKTGTAQKPVNGVYSGSANWDTFAGMVPADNPQFVVAIMVDNPAHGVEGGDVAAPLFHQIASYELVHARIAPSGAHSKHVPLQICNALVRLDSPSTVC